MKCIVSRVQEAFGSNCEDVSLFDTYVSAIRDFAKQHSSRVALLGLASFLKLPGHALVVLPRSINNRRISFECHWQAVTIAEHTCISPTSIAIIPNSLSTSTQLDKKKSGRLPTSKTFIQGIRLNQLHTQQIFLRSETHLLLPKNRRTDLQHSD
jgi:hypothetical protein